MRKNRLMWNIALFLIAIVSIPIAYAQTFTGSSWFFIVVNSLIVGVVLFLLQSFLMPGKDPKEKTAVWVAIIAGSLLVGFLFGRSGFIWATGPFSKFFNIYVLVNAFIIGIVAYFALGLLKVVNIQAPEGKTGYGILIFIGALVWAIGIANSYGNVFVWQAYKYFISYFIGPEGILNPYPPQYRLLVFAGSAVLLAFFFSNYLITGAGANKTVNYALALILAMNMASSGVSVRSVIILGEIIFVLVLQKALAGGPAQNKWVSWLFAIGLVGWASAAMTYGTDYQGAIATPIGWIMSWFGLVQAGTAAQPTSIGWWAKILFVVVGVMLLFGGGLLFISRGEIRRRLLTLGFTGLKKRLNAIFKFTEFMRETPEGREPQIFIENRLLFHMLANFTTRSEITYRYWGFVKQGVDVGQELAPEIGEFYNLEKLKREIIAYRSGGQIGHEHVEGWNYLNLEAVNLINEMFELMFRTYIAAHLDLKQQRAGYALEASQFTAIETRARNLLTRIRSFKEQYDLRTKAVGAHYVLKPYRDITFGMANPTGDVFEHTQLFAKPGAEFDDGTTARSHIEDGKEEPLDEINQYGEYLADIIAQKDALGDIDPIRFRKPKRLRNATMLQHPSNFTTHMKNIELDWKGNAEDIRYGLHHPKSRTFRTYLSAIGRKIYPEWADIKIKYTSPPTQADPAFDMSKLANPSKHSYWGRESRNDDTPSRRNPYPALSSLGLRNFLFHRVSLDMKNKDKAKEFIAKYPADTGAPEKKLPEAPIGMHLSELREGGGQTGRG